MAGRAGSLDRNRSNRFCRSDRREPWSCGEMKSSQEMAVELRYATNDLDNLMFEKKIIDARVHQAVNKIYDLRCEIAAAEIQETAHTLPEVVAQAAVKMEIL